MSHAEDSPILPSPGEAGKWVLRLLLIIVAVEVLASTWMYLDRRLTGPVVDIPGVTVFSPPRPLPAFTLTDHAGRTFDNGSLRGNWTLASFGYTSCPDFCPTALAEMARAFRSIAQIPGLVANTRYVFISVDPYRDNPERLAGYVTYFSPAFIGVTGTAKQLYQLSDQIGLHFEYVDRTTEQPLQDVLHKPASDDYSIDHYSGFLLINPAGRLAATILPPLGAEQTLVIYQKIRNHYEGTS